MKTPLLGGFYVSRSSNLSDQRCVNLYPEIVETKDGKTVGALYSTPGEDLMATVGNGPIRGLHVMGPNLFAVSGSRVYKVDQTWSSTLIGEVAPGSGSVSMIDNGAQLAIFDGTNGFCYDPTGYSIIVLPAPGPASAVYEDGFGLVNQAGTQTFWQSNYKDLKTWNGLNFGTADAKTGQVQAIASLHREVWLFGTNHTEVWVNAGTAGFAFQRLQGVFVEQGCLAPSSVAKMDDSLYWLGKSNTGQCIVYQTRGYQAKSLSTHAMAYAMQSYSTVTDAIGYAYQDANHHFYVLTFPTANVTWVYDDNAGLWHQRAGFISNQFQRHDGNAYALFNGRHVIGDWASGKLLAFNLNRYDDNGRALKWLRTWRALPPNRGTLEPITFDSLSIDCETGITTPANSSPTIMLRWSDDGGHTWSNEHWGSFGLTGQTATRITFRRLGQTRESSGLDRIWEVSSVNPTRAALVGAEMEAGP